MNDRETKSSSVALWIGRLLTGLLAAAFLVSGAMKLRGGPDFDKGFAAMGLPDSMRVPLGILELTCLAIYLFPPTSVVGAILLTGYMGGAICTHWRVGEMVVPQIVIGVLVWLALCLRIPKLWTLIPWRR